MKGAEEYFHKGSDIGVLVIHGFTGTPQSVRYLAEQIAKQGYTVLVPILSGHGTAVEELETFTYHDWIRDVETGWERLKGMCNKIFVIGFSMGGTLSLYLAEKYKDITGVITINAATEIPILQNCFDRLINSNTRFIKRASSNIKKVGVKEDAYPVIPVKSIRDFLTLMAKVRKDLHKITTPILIISSVVDHVVPPENSEIIYNEVSAPDKTIVFLKNSYHVATLDNDKELIVKECCRFIKNRIG